MSEIILYPKKRNLSGTLLVECVTDAEAAKALGQDAVAAGGPGDFTNEQMAELTSIPGLLYVLPDKDSLNKEVIRGWVWDLFPKAHLCPAEYGEGLNDLSDLVHKRRDEAAKVLQDLKARAIDALELELREVEESLAESSENLSTFRRVKQRILPLVLRLEDEGERDAALQDVRKRLGLNIKPLRKALDALAETEEAEAGEQQIEEAPEEVEQEVDPREVEQLIGRPGVLDRFVQDAATIHGVVGEENHLKLITLNAGGAQLAPLPNGRPAGANVLLTAEPGRGKNYLADAVSELLPEEFVLAFESASAMSFYYRAENDPEILKHRWIYPNEAEATDKLVEMLRPLISGAKASHLTVNKTGEGRNAAQELSIEGPVSVTIPTIRNKVDAQLQTRMLVSELPDYDGRVAAHSRAVSRQLLPDQASEDYGPKVRAWQAGLRSLTEMRRVVFPLDHEGFCFNSDQISHGARLWGNLLGLMLAHAWLEQLNRGTVELPSGERMIAATPEDYEAAYRIFESTCERSVVNLSDSHRKILDAVYGLKQENNPPEGFSQRKIAEKAEIHHSTVGEHRTFLVKSAKLLRETQSGMLDLVADAEPSWWHKEDLLEGFPHPGQVWRWWDEKESNPASKPARQTRHGENEASDAPTYAENSGGHSTRHPFATNRQPQGERPMAGRETAVADEVPAIESPIEKPDSNGSGPVAGVAGASENGGERVSPTDSRRLTDEEVEKVKRLIHKGMEQGVARAKVLELDAPGEKHFGLDGKGGAR